MSQLLLVLTRHEQVQAESAAGKWLDRIEPSLGNTVTEVTQTAPNELAFKRTAGGGLTAIELLALVDWLEAPNFPGTRFAPAAAASPAGAETLQSDERANSRRAGASVIMLKLGVNIDHVATLREARYRGRGFGEPDPGRSR